MNSTEIFIKEIEGLRNKVSCHSAKTGARKWLVLFSHSFSSPFSDISYSSSGFTQTANNCIAWSHEYSGWRRFCWWGVFLFSSLEAFVFWRINSRTACNFHSNIFGLVAPRALINYYHFFQNVALKIQCFSAIMKETIKSDAMRWDSIISIKPLARDWLDYRKDASHMRLLALSKCFRDMVEFMHQRARAKAGLGVSEDANDTSDDETCEIIKEERDLEANGASEANESMENIEFEPSDTAEDLQVTHDFELQENMDRVKIPHTLNLLNTKSDYANFIPSEHQHVTSSQSGVYQHDGSNVYTNCDKMDTDHPATVNVSKVRYKFYSNINFCLNNIINKYWIWRF